MKIKFTYQQENSIRYDYSISRYIRYMTDNLTLGRQKYYALVCVGFVESRETRIIQLRRISEKTDEIANAEQILRSY